MVIVFGSQKGGCGKTTGAINLAVKLSLAGKDVVLVDADPQASAANWVQSRVENNGSQINCIQRHGNISNTLLDLKKRYEYVIVDVSGHDSHELRSSMMAAEILVIPFKPSQFDLETLPHMTEVIDQASIFNTNLKVYGLLNMAPTNPVINEAEDAMTYLKDFPEIVPLQTVICERKAYRDATIEGKGVIELKNDKAIQEINDLTKELLGDKI